MTTNNTKEEILKQITQWIYAYNLNISVKDLNVFIETAERELPVWINPYLDKYANAKLEEVAEKMEKEKKNTKNEFDIGSEMSTPRIIRDNGFNSGITKAQEIINNLKTNHDTI